MKTLKKKLLAAKIEYYWWRIRREKKQGKQLLETGCQYSSKELVTLNLKYSKHCASVMRAQKEYEKTMKAG